MDAVQYKNFSEGFTVEQMMNRNFKVLHPEDSLRKVIEYYQQFKVNTLPVVNETEKLIGVFPKKRLYKALLEGADLETPCGTYMVEHPIFITVDRTYDEYSLVVRVTKSKVDNVVVLDRSGRVAGMIGTGEYLRGSLSVIMASSALMESLFRVNYEGIIITNQNGILLRINPAAAKLFGLEAELVKGKALENLLPEIEISEERRIGQKMILNGIPVIVSQVPIIENGEKIGFSFAFLDISDMEKIARELELVKELQHTVDGVLSASSDGVFVSDPEGIVRYVNERACRLLSCKAEDIIGKSIRDLLRLDEKQSTGSAATINCVETERKNRTGKSGTGAAAGAGVDVCNVQGKHCIVSHIPFLRNERQSIVSTVYLNDNAVTEEIARKWLYLNQQVQYYRDQLEKRNEGGRFQKMVSHNPAFTKIKNEAQLIARSSSTVLLTGESGVGKDMFARGIHEASPRAKQPFIKVSCVSIPETLFESELFGYAPGSFTGALKNGKPGYFERANKGTVFLDEIGDMPMSIQAKLLQVLQEKEFTRVGGSGKQSVDVRIIAATNRDLRKAIAEKTFREDLYYRLNVIAFQLPPLRERPEDIAALADAFVEKYNGILGARVRGISLGARDALQGYSWPGNIRELENAIERAANYVWEGEIGVENLPSQIVSSAQPEEHPPLSYRTSLIGFEREMLQEALNKTNGNRSAAARLLHLSRSSFYDRLEKYGMK